MPSKKGGYKIVSLGGLDLTGENLSLKGLYNALKISYGKPILLNGIVIDGEVKKDALVQADEGENVINIKHLYGYNLSVSSADAITVEVDSEGIELPVPEPEDDGKVVKVNVLGKYVLGEVSGGTKLYLHTISISSGSKLFILNGDSNAININYSGGTLLFNNEDAQQYMPKQLLVKFNRYAETGSASKIYYFNNVSGGGGTDVIIEDVSSNFTNLWSAEVTYTYTDTVTEL